MQKADTHVVTLPTSQGEAEARKEGRGAAWEVCYPWGAERFHGARAQVLVLMRSAIEAYEKAEAES